MSENKTTLKERVDEIVTKLSDEKLVVNVNKFDSGVKSAGAKFRKEARELVNLLRASIKFSLGKED